MRSPDEVGHLFDNAISRQSMVVSDCGANGKLKRKSAILVQSMACFGESRVGEVDHPERSGSTDPGLR